LFIKGKLIKNYEGVYESCLADLANLLADANANTNSADADIVDQENAHPKKRLKIFKDS
jgi:hypothetical protein